MRRIVVLATLALAFAVVGCGPGSSANNGNGDCNDPANLQVDPNNCGTCGNKCTSSQSCTSGVCVEQSCNPGETRACYDGAQGTMGVGPCTGGTQMCQSEGYWGTCMGEVVPAGEKCGNQIDDNCNGKVDEDVDADGDGFTTCGGDCCDATTDGCGDPKLVNPGAFEVGGNHVDDNCDGIVDNAVAGCDTGLQSNTTNAMDFAKAIDICQTATAGDKKWGVISATWTGADGQGSVDPDGHSIRDKFGTNVTPKGGASLAEISSGIAADANDNNPMQDGTDSYWHTTGASSGFPTDWYGANGNTLPNAPGCPPPNSSKPAQDPEMLTLTIRAPTNAKSFSLNVNFFSYEYPEYTCSTFNDFFVVLLDSSYSGSPANPSDKNLAFYQNPAMKKYPVGVNLAYGDTGLFTECKNGPTGCIGKAGTISTCKEITQLAGTGMDAAGLGCGTNNLSGGGTGWLQTSGNVKGGEIIKLRIAIWDTSDENLDSIAIFDNFQWSVDAANPGTIVVN